ncbi:MAG: hypothetical protein Q7S16_00685 [bacterium]|nr:hypothetical protein [bacterium]
MSEEEFGRLDGETIGEEMMKHLDSCPSCQALQAETEEALEPHFEAARATDTEDDIRKGFAEDPELAEQLIADAKEGGHTFAKDDEDAERRLELAAESSPRLKSLLESGEAPPPSKEEVQERIKQIQAEVQADAHLNGQNLGDGIL